MTQRIMQLGVIVGSMVVLAGLAAAASCGGTIPCQCGDTLTANYTLTANLGPCPDKGLLITGTTRRTLDLKSFAILGGPESDCGVCITGNNHIVRTSLTRGSGKISGFFDAVRIEGNANLVEKLRLHNNDHYGVALDGDNNTVRLNDVLANGDEGIHLSPGSTGNLIRQNLSQDNVAEQIYLLGADANKIYLNTMRGGTTGLYVKHSDNNLIGGVGLKNIHESPSQIVGDSLTNSVQDTFRRLFRIQPNEGFVPHGTKLTNSTLTNATGTCLRVDEATGTVVTGGSATNCGTDIVCNGPVGGPPISIDVNNFAYETGDVELSGCTIN